MRDNLYGGVRPDDQDRVHSIFTKAGAKKEIDVKRTEAPRTWYKRERERAAKEGPRNRRRK